VKSFVLSLLMVCIYATAQAEPLTSEHAANAECTQATDGIFANVSIDRIFEIFESDVRDIQSVSELLLNERSGHFEHPISQVMLAFHSVENGQSEIAFAHLEVASYLARRHQLCIRDRIEEISLIIRKRAHEEELPEGYPRQLYYSLTEGVLLPNLGLFSQQYSELAECIGKQIFVTTEKTNICI